MEPASAGLAFGAFAFHIGHAVIKIRRVWNQVQDVPVEIQELLNDLDLTSQLLDEMRTDFKSLSLPSDFWHGNVMQKCLQNAQKAHLLLESVVGEVHQQLSKQGKTRQRLVAMRVVMDKENIEKLEKRLQRSLDLFRWSCDNVSKRIQAKVMPAEITERLLAELAKNYKMVPISSPDPCRTAETEQARDAVDAATHLVNTPNSSMPETCHSNLMYGRLIWAYQKSTGAWNARCQPPWWWSRAVHEISCAPQISGWKYSYRSYNVVSDDSEIMRSIRNGDELAVRRLFDTRMASPYDRDETGTSLLKHAAWYQKPQICRLLLKLGLSDLLDEPVGPERTTPLSPLVLDSIRRKSSTERDEIVKMFRSYLQGPGSVAIERIFDYHREYSCNDEFMAIFRERFLPNYYQLPAYERLEAIKLGSFVDMTYCKSLRSLLSESGQISNEDVVNSIKNRTALLHSAAISLGRRFPDEVLPRKRPIGYLRRYDKSWSTFVHEIAVVSSADDLHTVETLTPPESINFPQWQGSPLISLIGGVLCSLSRQVSRVHWDGIIVATLRRWLMDLKAGGVDLLEYGKREHHAIHIQHGSTRGAFDTDSTKASRNIVQPTFARGANLSTMCRPRHCLLETEDAWIPIRLVDIVIGPNADDWKLLWAIEYECLALEFWDMIERSSVPMPGTWVDVD